MANSAAVAKMERLVANWLAVAAKGPLNASQTASLVTDLKTLAADLKSLSVVASTGTGSSYAPTPGLTNWAAAQLDAGFVFKASLGDTSGADTNPAPGAAKALGFSGVVGQGELYGTFVNGVLTATGPNPIGPNGYTTPFGLGASFDKDAPYTGSGAVRP